MIVDAHVHAWDEELHLGRGFSSELRRITGDPAFPLTVRPEQLINDLDQAGIASAIVQGFNARRQQTYVPFEWLRRFCDAVPGRLAVMATLDPTGGDIEGQMGDAVAVGACGFKLLPSYGWFRVTDPALRPVYEMAAQQALPVMIHASAATVRDAKFEFAHPRPVEDVAMAYPDLILVLAHLCYPWQEEAYCLARRFPNLYLDMSAFARRPSSLRNSLRLAAEYGVLDRIIYGSDFPFHGSSDRLLASIKETWSELSLEHDAFTGYELSQVLGERAARLWRLEKSA